MCSSDFSPFAVPCYRWHPSEMRFPACALLTHFKFIQSFSPSFLFLSLSRSLTYTHILHCHTWEDREPSSFIFSASSSFRLFQHDAQSVQKSCANICKTQIYFFFCSVHVSLFSLTLALYLSLFFLSTISLTDCVCTNSFFS